MKPIKIDIDITANLVVLSVIVYQFWCILNKLNNQTYLENCNCILNNVGFKSVSGTYWQAIKVLVCSNSAFYSDDTCSRATQVHYAQRWECLCR